MAPQGRARAAEVELQGAEGPAQKVLDARNYGGLRSNVFYLDVFDKQNNLLADYNGTDMIVLAAYKGIKSDLSDINVIVADKALARIGKLSADNLLMMAPASILEDGFVIFKMQQPGYFIVADK